MTMIEVLSPSLQLPIRIAFLDVGQADTIVVNCVNPRAVLQYLAQEHIQFLRSIIVTHLHTDHYSGVMGILENYHLVPDLLPCETVLFNKIYDKKSSLILQQDSDKHSSEYKRSATTLQKLLDWPKKNKTRYADLMVQAGQQFTGISGLLIQNFQLLHPYNADYEELEAKGLNNTSVVILVNPPVP